MSLSPLTDVDPQALNIMLAAALVLGFFTLLIWRMKKNKHPSAKELMGRTLTFWWMLGLMFVALATNPIVVLVLIGVLSLLAHYEFLDFFRPQVSDKLYYFLAAICIFTVVAAAICVHENSFSAFTALCFLPLVILAPTVFVLMEQVNKSVALLGGLGLSVLYFSFALGHSGFLLKMNVNLFLLSVILTEVRDLISYWMGKFFAKAYSKKTKSQFLKIMNYKIAAKVSPNKTWATGIISILAIMVLTHFSGELLPANFAREELLLAWGFLIGFFGLIGDLAFSMIKRDFGRKDSGSLLPGGTGVIDRIDSLVLTIPVSMHLFYWLL